MDLNIAIVWDRIGSILIIVLEVSYRINQDISAMLFRRFYVTLLVLFRFDEKLV